MKILIAIKDFVLCIIVGVSLNLISKETKIMISKKIGEEFE